MQWRNSSAVISWFQKIPCKDMCKFLKFDIVDFYPSITQDLLTKSLEFAQNYVEVDEHTANIIMHCRQSILFSNDSAWSKKSSPQLDVAMGSFDGAEVCELVGLYLLYHLSSVIGDKINIGLYRDDGLAMLEATSGPETDRIRKKIEKLFKDYNLHITTELGLIQTEFLDVTFNLKSGKYWPYRKPNDQPLYINAGSNHLPMIKKQLPSMLSKRLSELSYNHEEFEKAATPYNTAIKTSGYHEGLAYNDHTTDTHARRRNRKRNIVRFNPPFSESVKNNIGKEFLKLVDKQFPPHHHLRKVCNRNTLKISYSCMPNMATIISSYNKTFSITSRNQKPPSFLAIAATQRTALSMENAAKRLSFTKPITSDGSSKHYIGCSETKFKTRYYNHTHSFRYREKRNATKLSKAFWNAKDSGHEPSIKWSIADQATAYQPGSRSCNLCLTEKLAILLADKRTALNKTSELTGKCRHKNKYKLKNVQA